MAKLLYKLLVVAKVLEQRNRYRFALLINVIVEKVSIKASHRTNEATARAGRAFCYLGLKKYRHAKRVFEQVIADAVRLDNQEALSIAYLNTMQIDELLREE